MDKLTIKDIFTIGGFEDIKTFEDYIIKNNVNCLELGVQDSEAYLDFSRCSRDKKETVETRTFTNLENETYLKVYSLIENNESISKNIEGEAYAFLDRRGITLDVSKANKNKRNKK